MSGVLRRRRGSRGMSPGATLLVGALTLAACFLALVVGFNASKQVPFRSSYDVKAEFRDADNLVRTFQVRTAGRRIGQVLDTEVRDGRALVTMRLDADAGPLRSDTRLRVRPLSAVGVRFVELIPGRTGPELPSGATIPVQQTSSTVALDDALGTLDATRRREARQLLSALGGGFAGRGADVNDALDAAPELLAATARLGDAINATGEAPAAFVRAAQGAANAADPVRHTYADGFGPGADTLAPFSGERVAVQQALERAPATLRTVRDDLPRTSRLLRSLRRFAVTAQPVLDDAPSALRATDALLAEARPGLRRVPGTTRLLDRAVPDVLRLTGTLRPVLPRVDDTLRTSLPIVAELAPRACDLKRFTGNWASTLSWGDGFSNYLRYNVSSPDQASLGGHGSRDLAAGVIRSTPYSAPCEPDAIEAP